MLLGLVAAAMSVAGVLLAVGLGRVPRTTVSFATRHLDAGRGEHVDHHAEIERPDTGRQALSHGCPECGVPLTVSVSSWAATLLRRRCWFAGSASLMVLALVCGLLIAPHDEPTGVGFVVGLALLVAAWMLFLAGCVETGLGWGSIGRRPRHHVLLA